MTSPFIKHMRDKFPELDIQAIVDLVDKNVADIKPNPNNPIQEIRIFPGSDLNKNLIIKVIYEYLNPNHEKEGR
jgi:hypothetical protein